ncbi:hypothetical protein GGI59_003417 [Rhizobium lentis]|uniref:Uncharacterized protein n=1 Tax=Rhizobium lentis TaxID=1138194 RepID=A0A7W8XF94_9HYPH|nr:hypothetical protein [Rhizobium lentis]MBB5551204.1 hypothetical protein [Rhizobium lentis]MBB5561741.1 hypothetical protein [Rhizobium lentis]MBB5568325.1 hypothetical protein [Rhizobium lentis]
MMKRIFSALLALILPAHAAVSQSPDEAQARKARPIAQLQSEGVPTSADDPRAAASVRDWDDISTET